MRSSILRGLCFIVKVALLSVLFWASIAVAAPLPQPTFVGVGQHDGEDRVMLTFAEPLPVELYLAEHISASINTQAYTDWVIGPQRKIAWMVGVPANSKIRLKFTDRSINQTVFSHAQGGQIILSAGQPVINVDLSLKVSLKLNLKPRHRTILPHR